jgi:hypothetical protein
MRLQKLLIISVALGLIFVSSASSQETIYPDSVLYPDRLGNLPRGDSMMIYTAHQSFDSRIYILDLSGNVQNYFHYTNYFFGGLEVVDGEVYAAEAFAPRVLKVNLADGSLEVIVDDWSLYYFYDVCFDGTYFYVDEWDMSRYEFNGDKDGTASFDEDVMGLEYDGSYLWMQNDQNQIKCYDISGWPSMIEIPENSITPPTPDCRGLFFDGQNFWTAESLEGELGRIFKFDYDGNILLELWEPAFRGWGVCLVEVPTPPCVPENPFPPDSATDVSIETDLSWQCSDYDPAEVGFNLYMGETEPLTLIAEDLHQNSFSPDSIFNPQTDYMWQVIARDQDNDTTVSPIWTFTTESVLICGDANSDELVDVSDAVFIINYAFGGGTAPDPLETGDANCDDSVDVSDAVYIISYAFSGGNPPCDIDGDDVPDC